jgi:selenide,water dikinase
LIGFDLADDAGVYRLRKDLAIVQTVDFFTPIVDDPYAFGRIAAANALSDVYAMGARPLTALNLVAFPVGTLDLDVLRQVLDGGLERLTEAGVCLLGGHSIDDAELKYGLAVTGLVDPRKVVTNAGMQAGDRLVLTKPLGTGLIGTAIKADMAEPSAVTAAVDCMVQLNRQACDAMLEVGAHACTDVTGYGLLGHLGEMVEASGAGVMLDSAALPVLAGALEAARMGLLPAGGHRNRQFRQGMVKITGDVGPEMLDILYDPQTSGGLLIAVSAEKTDRLLAALRRRGVNTQAVIGEVLAEPPNQILVQ